MNEAHTTIVFQSLSVDRLSTLAEAAAGNPPRPGNQRARHELAARGMLAHHWTPNRLEYRITRLGRNALRYYGLEDGTSS